MYYCLWVHISNIRGILTEHWPHISTLAQILVLLQHQMAEDFQIFQNQIVYYTNEALLTSIFSLGVLNFFFFGQCSFWGRCVCVYVCAFMASLNSSALFQLYLNEWNVQSVTADGEVTILGTGLVIDRLELLWISLVH